MSQAASASTGKNYGLALVCRVWALPVPRYTGDVGVRSRLFLPNDVALKVGIAMRSWLSTSRPRFGKALFTARGIARSGLAFGTKGSGLPRREHCASCAKTRFRPTSGLAGPMD